MPFWRRESLHERLAREGGLLYGQPPHETHPRWGEPGIHGVARPRQWDTVVTLDAPDVAGDELHFVVLPDGTLLLDDEVDEDAVAPLAEAVEQSLAPPYRARAVRRGGDTWAVGANAIDVVEVPDVDGEEVELTVTEDGRTLVVDGRPAFGSVPGFERLPEHDAYALRASRLDGDLWEVRISPL